MSMLTFSIMKPLFILYFLMTFANLSFGQSRKSCFQISQMMNFEEILKNFHLFEKSDSLVLIDKNGIVSDECMFVYWGRNRLQITHDTQFSKNAIKGGSAVRFKNQCQYFVIESFKQKSRSYTFTIFQACSNKFIDCEVIYKKKRYKLIRFNGGIY